jgi:YHS domain-containing protein
MKSVLTLIVSILVGSSLAQADVAGIPKDYPLKTCPVSKEVLGSDEMTPFKLVHDGTEVWLCCKSCKRKFDKDAAKYVQIVRDARK